MVSNVYLIRQIYQKDRTRFTIVWTDDKISTYRLSDLQRECSCAQCRDEQSGHILVDVTTIDPEVEAIKIFSIGRYAIQIVFTSGCSKGIYTYAFLREKDYTRLGHKLEILEPL